MSIQPDHEGSFFFIFAFIYVILFVMPIFPNYFTYFSMKNIFYF